MQINNKIKIICNSESTKLTGSSNISLRSNANYINTQDTKICLNTPTYVY